MQTPDVAGADERAFGYDFLRLSTGKWRPRTRAGLLCNAPCPGPLMRGTRSPYRMAVVCALGLAACRGDSETGPNFSGPPVPIALKFCAAVRPAWVGYQNGNGPWVTVSQDASAQYNYSFSINGGGALAFVLP